MRRIGRRARHRASTVWRSIRRAFRRLGIAGALVVALTVSTITAIAGPAFAITAPTAIEYESSQNGFKVDGITITDPPTYIQVGLTLTYSNGQQVENNDIYRIAAGTQCSFDSTWVNSATSGEVIFSGDNSTNLLMAGDAVDVEAALANIWIYADNSAFCSGAGQSALNTDLLSRLLKVTAVESHPGVFWSPGSQHYYQLATNITDDGLGQPTDNSGNVTDSSRYFVKWSTARAAAKNASLIINGNSHQGYLAAITTKDEFQFLNYNVTGGRGTIYPAWVGGTDQGHEGTWKWVDGPEAAKFGGDSITGAMVGQSGTVLGQDYVATGTDSNGNTYYQRSDGNFFFASTYNIWDYDSFWGYGLIVARDADGNVVTDSAGNALLIDTDNCYNQPDPPAGDARFQPGESGWVTPDGGVIHCGWEIYTYYPYPYITDANGNNVHFPDESAVWPSQDMSENYITDSNGYVVQVDTNDITIQSTFDPSAANFEGATFWGPDSGSSYGSNCTRRGTRGYCQVAQKDINGTTQSNSYYVHWSNGSASNYAYWDGYNYTPGDGVYSPQPDNAALSPTNDENALIINWCAKNDGITNTTAPTETLYGNPGYYCTPGWNDLPWDAWNNTGTGTDSPNNIGTTDYVIEYCGYVDEATCSASSAQVVTVSFALTGTICPVGGNPNLSASYAAAGVMTTDLTSSTMTTENFDGEEFALGSNSGGTAAIGTISGTYYMQPANVYGGSGGTGKYPTPTGAGFTVNLTTEQKYLGFWWSAGSADNHVQLLDANDHILACFDAVDLVNTLGTASNYSDYLGNPVNRNWAAAEPFAFVHLRLPTGFAKVRFYGAGFELDSISVSQTVPSNSSSETFLNPRPASIALRLPTQVPVDPRATQARLPQLRITGSTDATLCYRQVADSSGTPLVGSTSINFGTSSAMTAEPAGPYFALYGSIAQVQSNSGGLLVGRNDYAPLMQNGLIYIEVATLPTADSPTAALCDASTTRQVFVIRPYGLLASDTVPITMRH